MEQRESAVLGCLLGMAVGDAMGYPVDKLSFPEICENYGPNGLLGYDLVNGSADITSYTQLAAFVCNGLMLGVLRGNMDNLQKFIHLGLREWLKSQQVPKAGEKTFCWLSHVNQMRRRLCMDTRLLDALSRENLGTVEKPVFRSDTPSSLTGAVAVGLLFDSEKMRLQQVGLLGAQTVATTHGEPESFLSGAVLAYLIAGILHAPEESLVQTVVKAVKAVQTQFSNSFCQTEAVADKIAKAIEYTKDPELTPLAAMSLLGCTTASECLAGAVYVALIHPANFDEGLIAGVNHSGRSSAVGAVAGAILGAKLGAEALPEFYLESLESAPVLQELAGDIAQQRQLMRIFDDDWDQKYVQGRPVS